MNGGTVTGGASASAVKVGGGTDNASNALFTLNTSTGGPDSVQLAVSSVAITLGSSFQAPSSPITINAPDHRTGGVLVSGSAVTGQFDDLLSKITLMPDTLIAKIDGNNIVADEMSWAVTDANNANVKASLGANMTATGLQQYEVKLTAPAGARIITDASIVVEGGTKGTITSNGQEITIPIAGASGAAVTVSGLKLTTIDPATLKTAAMWSGTGTVGVLNLFQLPASATASVNLLEITYDSTGGNVTPSAPGAVTSYDQSGQKGFSRIDTFNSSDSPYTITKVSYSYGGIAAENTLTVTGRTPVLKTKGVYTVQTGATTPFTLYYLGTGNVQTTYANQGWRIQEHSNESGLEIWYSTKELAGTDFTEVCFWLYNPTNSTKIANFSMDSDVMINGDDRATVYPIAGNYGFYMSGNGKTLAVVNPNEGVNGAKAYNWWGYWSQRHNYVNNTTSTSSIYSGQDSGAVAKIRDISVDANEFKSYSLFIGTGSYQEIQDAINTAIQTVNTPPVTIGLSVSGGISLMDNTGNAPLGDLTSSSGGALNFRVYVDEGYVLTSPPTVERTGGGTGAITVDSTPVTDETGTYYTVSIGVGTNNLDGLTVNANPIPLPDIGVSFSPEGYMNISPSGVTMVNGQSITNEAYYLFVENPSSSGVYIKLGPVPKDANGNPVPIDFDVFDDLVASAVNASVPNASNLTNADKIKFHVKAEYTLSGVTGWSIRQPAPDAEAVRINMQTPTGAAVWIQTDTDPSPDGTWVEAPDNGMYLSAIPNPDRNEGNPAAPVTTDNAINFAIRPEEGYTLAITSDPTGSTHLTSWQRDSNDYNGGTFIYPGGGVGGVSPSPFESSIQNGTITNLAEAGDQAIGSALIGGVWDLATTPVDPDDRRDAIEAVAQALEDFIGTSAPDNPRSQFEAAFPECDMRDTDGYNQLTDPGMVIEQLAREIVDGIIAGGGSVTDGYIADTFGGGNGSLFNDYVHAQDALEDSAGDVSTPVTGSNGTKPRATINVAANGDTTIGIIDLFGAGVPVLDRNGDPVLDEQDRPVSEMKASHSAIYIGNPDDGIQVLSGAALTDGQIDGLRDAGYITIVSTDDRGYEVTTKTIVTMNKIDIEGTDSYRGKVTSVGGIVNIDNNGTAGTDATLREPSPTYLDVITPGSTWYKTSAGDDTWTEGAQPKTPTVTLTADPEPGAYLTGFFLDDIKLGAGITSVSNGGITTFNATYATTGTGINNDSTLTYTPAGAVGDITVQYRNLLGEINGSSSNGADAKAAMDDSHFQYVFGTSNITVVKPNLSPDTKNAYEIYSGLNDKLAVAKALEKAMNDGGNGFGVAEVKAAFEALVELQQDIEAAQNQNQQNYTSGTWAVMQEALGEAQALMNKADGSVSTSDLNAASSKLEAALAPGLLAKILTLQIQSNLEDINRSNVIITSGSGIDKNITLDPSHTTLSVTTLTTSFYHYQVAGGTVKITITPPSGYRYTATLDGSALTPVNNVITLSNFNQSRLLKVIFENLTVNVGVPNVANIDNITLAGSNMAVDGRQIPVNYGDAVTFFIDPASGLMLRSGATVAYSFVNSSGVTQGGPGTVTVGLDGGFTIPGSDTATAHNIVIDETSLRNALVPLNSGSLIAFIEELAGQYPPGQQNEFTAETWAELQNAMDDAEEALYNPSGNLTPGDLQNLYDRLVNAASGLIHQYEVTMPSADYVLKDAGVPGSGVVEIVPNTSPKSYYVAQGKSPVLQYTAADGKTLGTVSYTMGGIVCTTPGDGNEAVLYGVSGDITITLPTLVDAGFGVADDPNPNVTGVISNGDTYTITPKSGYQVTEVTVDEEVVLAFDGNEITGVNIGDNTIAYTTDGAVTGSGFTLTWSDSGKAVKVDWDDPAGSDFTATFDPATGAVKIKWDAQNTGGHTVTSRTDLVGATGQGGITVQGIRPDGTLEDEGKVTPGNGIKVNLPATGAGSAYNPAAVIEYENDGIPGSVTLAELEANGGVIPGETADGIFAITGVTDGKSNPIPLVVDEDYADLIGEILKWEEKYKKASDAAVKTGDPALTGLVNAQKPYVGSETSSVAAILADIFAEADDDDAFLNALNEYLDALTANGTANCPGGLHGPHAHTDVADAINEISEILAGMTEALQGSNEIGDALLPYGFAEELNAIHGFVDGPVTVEINDNAGSPGDETLELSGITAEPGFELEAMTISFDDGSTLKLKEEPIGSGNWHYSTDGGTAWTPDVNGDKITVSGITAGNGITDYDISLAAGLFDNGGEEKTITGITFEAEQTGQELPGVSGAAIAGIIKGYSDLGGTGANLVAEIQDSSGSAIAMPNSVVPNDGFIVLTPTYGEDTGSGNKPDGTPYKHEFVSITIGDKTFNGNETNSPITVGTGGSPVTIDVAKAIEAGVTDFTDIVINTQPTNPQYTTFIKEMSDVKNGLDEGTISLEDGIKEIERLIAQAGTGVLPAYRLTDDNKSHLKDELEQLKVWKEQLDSALDAKLESKAISDLYNAVENALPGTIAGALAEGHELTDAELAVVMNHKKAIEDAKKAYDQLPQPVKNNIDPAQKGELSELTDLLGKALEQTLSPEENFKRIVEELNALVSDPANQYSEYMQTLIDKAQDVYNNSQNPAINKGRVIPEKNLLDKIVNQVDAKANQAATTFAGIYLDKDGNNNKWTSANKISSIDPDEVSVAMSHYNDLPQAVKDKVDILFGSPTLEELYAQTFPAVAGLLTKAQILEQLDKDASSGVDYIKTADLTGGSLDERRKYADKVVTAKPSYDNLTQPDKNSLNDTLTTAGGQDYEALYAAALNIVNAQAVSFVGKHLKPAGGGNIYTAPTEGNYEQILGGRADWNNLTKAEQNAVNAALKAAGSAYTYPQMLAQAEVVENQVNNVPIPAAKAAAIAALDAAYNAYSKSDYSDAEWAKLAAAYEQGKAGINTANTHKQIANAKQNALDGMKAAQKLSSGSSSGGSGGSGGGGGGGSSRPSSAVDEATESEASIDPDLVPEGSGAGGETADVSALLNTEQRVAYLTGRGSDLFAPQANMTRAEVAQMFYNLLRDKHVAATKSFPDIEWNAWYAQAVNTLASLGIISGFEDGGYKPNANITRAQMAAIAVQFARISQGNAQFNDVPQSHWAYAYINSAANYNWVTGVGDGLFEPNRNITRAEAVSLVNNMLGRIPDKEVIDNDTTLTRFSDVSPSHWAYYDIMEAANAYVHKGTE